MAVVESPDLHRHATRRDLAYLVAAIAALILALAILISVLYHVTAPTRAIPFDADGVRCYSRADSIVCLKTAEPPR